LRRARVRLARSEIGAAHQDLRTAISELNLRLTGARSVPSLLVDRGYAYALLGDTVLARRDLEAARQSGAEDSILRRVEAALADRG
jgi:Flp pilus assembly protein TadD